MGYADPEVQGGEPWHGAEAGSISPHTPRGTKKARRPNNEEQTNV
jgi:hypothetical protein